jgi:ubiquinone/menaquinone biosynthesis C-methylase UbiE
MPVGEGSDFNPTWDPQNVFAGTARYYARYRPQYPDVAIVLLTEKFKLDKYSRVLDVGCGPGHLTLKLAPHVARVIALDPLEEMLDEGRRAARELHLSNIDWLCGESGMLAELAARIGCISLTVMGRSFHWMNREQTLRDLYSMTGTGGGIAVITDSGPKDRVWAPWREIIWDTVKKWLGEERRAGTNGTYTHPEKHHQRMLQESHFQNMEIAHIDIERNWTLDELVGYLYSASATSVPVLGNKKGPFEAELRERLTEYEPSGRFYETGTVQIIMAWKR